MGAAALGTKIYITVATAGDLNYVTEDASLGTEGASPTFDTLLYGGIFVTPFLAGTFALLGGGMSLRGQWQAQQDFASGTPAGPRLAHRKRLGWALFGAGLGLWVTSRFVGGFACLAAPTRYSSEVCGLAVLETGYYASAAMVTAGMLLAPYALAYERRLAPRQPKRSSISLLPMLTPTGLGFSASGRF